MMAEQSSGPAENDAAAYRDEVNAFRREKDDFFGSAPQSPVPSKERRAFHGLRYFAPDLAYRVEAQVVPFEQPQLIEMETSTGDVRPQMRYAELRFRLGDQDLRLIGFAEPGDLQPEELFIPFRDATSAHETYGAGRYLETPVEYSGGEGTATLDFNLAYNPYCAYSPYYSCPIPPAENTLPVRIEAGERTYEEGH